MLNVGRIFEEYDIVDIFIKHYLLMEIDGSGWRRLWRKSVEVVLKII